MELSKGKKLARHLSPTAARRFFRESAVFTIPPERALPDGIVKSAETRKTGARTLYHGDL
jgi:hypothetical protein